MGMVDQEFITNVGETMAIGSPFQIDWRNYAEVCAYCDRLNAYAKETHKSVVIQLKSRPNYNITFKTNAIRAGQTILHPKGE